MMEDNNAFFNKMAPFYDYLAIVLQPFRLGVVDLVGTKQKVLDVACGTGAVGRMLAKKGNDVVGVDSSHDMVEIGRKKAGKNPMFVVSDSSKMPFRKRTFDVSLITFAFHHMPREVILGTLDEMRRVTKKGGKIIIADVEKPSTLVSKLIINIPRIYESIHYVPFYSKGPNYFLNKAGLKIIKEEKKFFGSVKIIVCEN